MHIKMPTNLKIMVMVSLELLASSNMPFMSWTPMDSLEKAWPLEALNCTKVSPLTLARMEISAGLTSKKVTRTSPIFGALGWRPTYSVFACVWIMVLGPTVPLSDAASLFARSCGSLEKKALCRFALSASVSARFRGFSPPMERIKNSGSL